MTINDVRIRLSKPGDRVKAYCSFSIDNAFVVHDAKVLKTEDTGALIVAMPSRKRPDGQFVDVAHPLNKETRDMIQEAVLEAYEKALNESQATHD